jgi:hypothetical protein
MFQTLKFSNEREASQGCQMVCFQNKNPIFGLIFWRGLAMEEDGIFYGHLVHFTVFCFILWTFVIVRGNLVYFSRFGILYRENSGNPEAAQPGLTDWSVFSPIG